MTNKFHMPAFSRQNLLILNLVAGTVAGISFAIAEQIGPFWNYASVGRGTQMASILALAGFAGYLASWVGLARKEKPDLKRIDCIPLIALLGGALLLASCDLILFAASEYALTLHGLRIFAGVCGLLMLVIILVTGLSIVRRIKSGRFWEFTLWGAYHRVSKQRAAQGKPPLFAGIRAVAAAYRENTSLGVRAVITLTLLAVFQFLLILFANDWDGRRLSRMQIMLFLLYKLPETGLILWIILQMNRIREGTERIVEGHLTETIATKYMKGEFLRYAESLNRLQNTVSRAVDEQMRSERMRTELITNVSHDLKTPITGIISYIDLMGKEEIAEPKVREYCMVLERQAGKLKKLVEDLVEVSKASAGTVDLHMERCDAGIMLDQAIGEFSERFTDKGLLLEYSGLPEAKEEGVFVRADGRYLWRVFDNLLTNIVKYAMPGTRVYIDLAPHDDGKIAISFKNISEAKLNVSAEELMERFVRGDASRSTEGSGLGLSIADSLLRLMGGQLNVTVDGDLFKAVVLLQADR